MNKNIVSNIKRRTKIKIKNITNIAVILMDQIFEKALILITLVSLINMAVPQIALAGTVDLPVSDRHVRLPYSVGKEETLERHPEDVFKLPVLLAEKAPRYSLRVTVTAYNSEAGQTDSTPCITASGMDVCERFKQSNIEDVVATNFMNLPFGTKIRFPELSGDKIYRVEDRMNKRYQKKFDIWMNDRAVAVDFGVKYKTLVEIF